MAGSIGIVDGFEGVAVEGVSPGGTTVWKPAGAVVPVTAGKAAPAVVVCTGARAGGGSCPAVGVGWVVEVVEVVASPAGAPAAGGWIPAGGCGAASAGGTTAEGGDGAGGAAAGSFSSADSDSSPDSIPSVSEALVSSPSEPSSSPSAATVDMGMTVLSAPEFTTLAFPRGAAGSSRTPAPPVALPLKAPGSAPAETPWPVVDSGRATGLTKRPLSASSPESSPEASPSSSRRASHARWLFRRA
jgi:hypothetical protein